MCLSRFRRFFHRQEQLARQCPDYFSHQYGGHSLHQLSTETGFNLGHDTKLYYVFYVMPIDIYPRISSYTENFPK